MENAGPIGGENMSPSGRWVLKCPFHALWLDSVVEEFPDADFIVTHRPADQMVPSWAKFQAMTFRMLYDENSHSDSREVAKLTADSFEEKLERLEVERSRQEAQGKVRLGPTRRHNNSVTHRLLCGEHTGLVKLCRCLCPCRQSQSSAAADERALVWLCRAIVSATWTSASW